MGADVKAPIEIFRNGKESGQIQVCRSFSEKYFPWSIEFRIEVIIRAQVRTVCILVHSHLDVHVLEFYYGVGFPVRSLVLQQYFHSRWW